ncbi:hypothetical protein FBUS_05244 [Fasciolopsis buskii]|uniref:Uncharacterized protein n=1 Tax=Fasciolopsis buskii TaxID=27845 RepID=A0A8E0RNZ3_9TREM|nr:hypothetical protein FBUS_05244 [Fasciolopsis buski]
MHSSTIPSNLSSLSGLGDCPWSTGLNTLEHSPAIQPENRISSTENPSTMTKPEQFSSIPSPSDPDESRRVEQTQADPGCANTDIPPVHDSTVPTFSPYWWTLLLTPPLSSLPPSSSPSSSSTRFPSGQLIV